MSLIERLHLKTDGHIVISVVGAGGKTSVVRRLCEEYRSLGKKTVVTTSTHMLQIPEVVYRESTALSEVRQILEMEGAVHTGVLEPIRNGLQKIASPDSETVRELNEMCDVMIVEADGAQMKCVKVPAPWEPVIWDCTDVVIGVLGADAIGGIIETTAYRPEDFAAFLGKKPEDFITLDDIITIAQSESGLRKCVNGRAFHFILNKTDLLSDSETVEAAVKEVDGICNSFR